MKWLDGKKRYLLLIVFVVESVFELAGAGNISDVIKQAVALTGWTPSDTFAGAAVVGQLVASAFAIVDGWRKDRDARLRLVR